MGRIDILMIFHFCPGIGFQSQKSKVVIPNFNSWQSIYEKPRAKVQSTASHYAEKKKKKIKSRENKNASIFGF